MGSRLWRKGTVVTRVRNLLRAGVLKENPVWLEVVEAFPPPVEPRYNRKPAPGRPPVIEYPEDKLIDKFYEVYRVPSVNIFETSSEEMKATQSANCAYLEIPDLPRARFVRRQMEMMKNGLSESEAFQVASSELMKFSGKVRQPGLRSSLTTDESDGERVGSEKNDQLNMLLDYFKTVKERAEKKESVSSIKKTLVQTGR